MFNQQGLSLDQAPPIEVVFRFFLAGTLFGILAGVETLFFGDAVLDSTSREALVLTHTLTLGVMMSFMFGALFQMLPVIAGVKFNAPQQTSLTVLPPLVIGTLSLLTAFYTGSALFFTLASVILGATLLLTAGAMQRKLLALKDHGKSSLGMIAALGGLTLLTLAALYLAGSYAGWVSGAFFVQVKQAHIGFGLLGWIGLLIASVSFQVIEMFYVTPPYPKPATRYVPFAVLGFLAAGLLLAFVNPVFQAVATAAAAVMLMAYAGITLLRLSQRKRPIADATVWFWRVGMGALIVAMAATADVQFMDIAWLKTLAYIAFATFALSVVFAMFYKIVPFLTWFHLNAQGYFDAPMMHEVIHPKTAMKHLYIHLATLATFLLSLLIPALAHLAGALLALSFGWATRQLLKAWKLYYHTQKHGQKFEMNVNGQ